MKRFIKPLLILLSLCFLCVVPASADSIVKMPTFTIRQNYTQCQQILKLVNKERKKAGLSALTLDKTLTNNAINRAAELYVMIPWTSPHMRPNGKEKTSINSAICYECCMESGHMTLTAASVVDRWMESPSHRKGILLPSAKSIGIAAIHCPLSEYPGGHYVLEFSNNKAKSVLKTKGNKDMSISVPVLSKYCQKKYFKIYGYTHMIKGGPPPHDEFSMVEVLYKSPDAVNSVWISSKAFVWKSSNPELATVDANGYVTWKGDGVATITGILKVNKKIKLSVKLEW